LQLAQTIALCHHEKWNGRGYPAGLAGHDIPQAARIVGIVDVYDAVTHGRIYRPPLSQSEALAVMIDKSASHFDPDLLELFLSLLPEMRQICEEHRDPPIAKNLIMLRAHQEARAAEAAVW
jgi:putative two-component system response regulator